MFDPKIKIDSHLYAKVKERAEALGYSSADEFVIHLLEQIVEATSEEDVSEGAIRKRLQGLGYLG